MLTLRFLYVISMFITHTKGWYYWNWKFKYTSQIYIKNKTCFLQDFTLDFYFRQFWTDPRLAYKKRTGVETLSVGSEFIKNIWVPDTFFVNEKQSYFHIATTSNEFIRIHYSGSITRSIRYFETVAKHFWYFYESA